MLLPDNYLSDGEMSKMPCWDLPSRVPGLHQATKSPKNQNTEDFPAQVPGRYKQAGLIPQG